MVFFQQLLEIASALPDLNLGIDHEENDDEIDLGQTKHRTPRVSYDKGKNNGDLASIEIYQQYLDDDDDDEKDSEIPFNAEERQPKLDQ